MRLLISIFSFIALASFAQADQNSQIGFKNGNEIEIIELRGNLTAVCRADWGGTLNSYYNCSGYTVAPGSHDYFVHPSVDADSVELVVHHEKGTTKKVSSKFDSEKGRSSKRFNLAIWSLTQRPILEEGTNRVDYALSKNNKSVRNGTFKATKEVTEQRRCRSRTIYFGNDMDCRNQNFACDEYFRQERNCRY